jgi:RNA polymerase sigma-70 factor (ECF subfamily)
MDRELIEQAKHGDRESFATLARVHGDRLMGIAQRILHDFDLAEDAVQQTLVIAWRELPRLRDPARFEVWLHRILVNACYSESRRARVWSSHVRVLPIEPYASDASGQLADRDELERGLRRLPPEQRAVLVLRHYLGLPPADIAETLGIRPGTVRARLHHAHRALRAALDAEERALTVNGAPLP